MKLSIVLFCFIGACSAQIIYLEKRPVSVYPENVIQKLLKQISPLKENPEAYISVVINEYVENVLKLAPQFIVKNGLDPMPVDDIEEGFSVKVGLITWHGEFSLTKGWMQGLSSIMRSEDDAIMNYEAQLLNLRIPLKFDVININFDYLAKVMEIGPTGGVEGKIKDLNVFIDITIDTKTTEIILQGFEITDAGKITIHFSGNPLVDWLTNVLTSLATKLLHGVAVDVVENKVRDLLQNTIDNINNQLHPSQYSFY